MFLILGHNVWRLSHLSRLDWLLLMASQEGQMSMKYTLITRY